MSEAIKKQVDDLVGYNDEMLQHAEAGDWKNVALVEEHRRKLLNKLFSNTSMVEGIPEINKTIQKIIAINKKLETLACSARDDARTELEKIKEGRLAVNSYVQHV
jgi:hypothetical protein